MDDIDKKSIENKIIDIYLSTDIRNISDMIAELKKVFPNLKVKSRFYATLINGVIEIDDDGVTLL